jgi:hypothetical protein
MYGTLISSVTVGAGGASSIDFTSIPGTYTDLVVLLSVRSNINITSLHDMLYLKLNGSTSITVRDLYGNGSSAASSTASGTNQISMENGLSTTASTFTSVSIHIPNYAGSANKVFSVDSVSENNATSAFQYLTAGIYNSSSAITSVGFTNNSTFVQYSTAYLYGLTKGSGGATVS